MALAGSIRTFTETYIDTDFHGWIRFYANELVEDPQGTVVRAKNGGWRSGPGVAEAAIDDKRYRYIEREYRAKFTDGWLVTIVHAPSATAS